MTVRLLRQLLVATVVTVAGVLAVPALASAQEEEGGETAVEEVIHEAEENGASHADAECVEILAEGGSVTDCQEAPNPLLPETNEIIWGAFGFFVVLAFIWKFGYPAIKQGMDARADRIRNDLSAAEAQRHEADQVLTEYRSQLANARSESSRIIEETRQQADTMKRDLAARAEADIAEVRQKAAADIEAAKVQAIADLRGEVTALAIGAAEQVIGRNLDDATNRALVDSYINQVGAAR